MKTKLTPEQRKQKLLNGRIRYSLNVAAMAAASDHRWRGIFANACMRHDTGYLLPHEKPAMEAMIRHREKTANVVEYRRALNYDRQQKAKANG